MNRYIDENEVYKLVEPRGVERVHCSQIDALPRADVVDVKVVREIFEELEKFMSPYRYPIIADLRKKYLGEDINVLTSTEESTDA